MNPPHVYEVTRTCDAYPLGNSDIFTRAATVSAAECYLCPNDEHQYFNIQVKCTNWHWRVPSLDYSIETTDHVFSNISKHSIQQQTNFILSCAGVPEGAARRAMEAKILECAETMANVTHKNHKILSMAVIIQSHTWINEDDNEGNDGYDDDYDRVVEESILENIEGHGLVPASESSIEGLERVKVEQQDGLCDCTICFEDFRVDFDALRMPCSHLFHRICIVNWLNKGNFCPLCRYQMPTRDS